MSSGFHKAEFCMEYKLLEKTELWISPVKLEAADLSECARAVGNVLGLGEGDILVTDALNDRLTLDVLVTTVRATDIVGRQDAVMEALSAVPGVTLTSETSVHSEGILGLISLDPKTGEEILERSLTMRDEIERRIARRALVIATGPEVATGQIKDTNTPYLVRMLQDAGYQADPGPVLEDRRDAIVRAFRIAAENAYGLVVTTGGVGAEGKDQTVEALVALAPDAAAPYVLKFRRDDGRHAKDGVRIGVGRWEHTLIVNLPGPHDEVRLLWPVLGRGLLADWEPVTLADRLAETLREKFLVHSSDHADARHHDLMERIHGSD
jgi:molybdenum cofactor synthesis domain-containing protein